jgi:hypothetical protein
VLGYSLVRVTLLQTTVERLLVCVGVLFGAGDVAADYYPGWSGERKWHHLCVLGESKVMWCS